MPAVQWKFWEGAHWDPAAATFVFENFVKGTFGRANPIRRKSPKAPNASTNSPPCWTAQLKRRKWLCGATLTVADFSLGAVLTMAEPGKLPLASFTEIRRWYQGAFRDSRLEEDAR